MKVLILSCSTGGGHNTCAKYVKEELEDNNIKCTFKDFYDIVNENAKELSSKLYLSSLGKNGGIFKNVYRLGELYSSTGLTSPVYMVNKLHKKKLYNYIIKNNYTHIISTHLFPALTLTAINKEIKDGSSKLKFIFIATDYEPCPFMEETKPNYLIMAKGLEERFIEKGNNKEVLYNSGIPISTRYINSAKNIKEKLNIKTPKTVLILLGSMGFGNIKETLIELLKIKNTTFIVVCGSNKKLFIDLKEIKNDNLIVFGYTQNINDLIYTSDIVLSKPGGLSTTEIVTFRKPLIHIFPIPGIETYNAQFFEKMHMSLVAKTNEDIILKTKKLLENQNMQEEMKKACEENITKYSAQKLVNLLKELN